MHPFAPHDPERPPWIVGHRGAAGYAPENTLESFRLGWDLGADLLELDLRLTADSILVALHDDDLSRVAGVALEAEDETAEALRYAYPVPTLDEVLDARPEGAWVNLELKRTRVARERMADRVVEALPVRDARVLVSSFDHELLDLIREREPTLPLVPITGDDPSSLLASAQRLGSPTAHVRAGLVDAQLPGRAAAEGIELWAYTVNRVASAQRLVEKGVRGLFTDYPDRLRLAFG